MPELHGTCDQAFVAARDALQENLDDGTELGLSMYVDIDGQTVLDTWGGSRDRSGNIWERDTLVNVWSTTKTVTALAVLMLVDRELIDIDAPVADYWPEFAQNGKETVLVRHLLGHTSGLSGFAQPFSNEDCYDQDASTRKLAEQAPWWEPGSTAAYHATTLARSTASSSVGCPGSLWAASSRRRLRARSTRTSTLALQTTTCLEPP